MRAILVFLLLPALVQAAPPSFSKNETLGPLRLRLPVNLETAPLATLETHRMTRTWSDGRKETLDMQQPAEVWFRSQHLADWKDKTGAAFTLAAPTALPPAAWPQPYATREEYADLMKRLGRSLTPEFWPDWLETFTGKTFTESPPASRVPPNLSALRFYQNKTTLALLFTFNARATGQTGAPETPYALIITPASAADIAGTRRALENQFIPALQYRAPRAATASGRVRQHPSRDAARQTITALPNWQAYDTNDYITLTNLSKNMLGTLTTLTDELQLLRGTFARYFPPAAHNREDDVSVIRVFADPADYLRYVGPSHEWSIGIFSPARRELVIKGDSEARFKEQLSTLRTTIYHEGFHQFLFHYTHAIETAVWFNEGHATFFETANVSLSAKRATPADNPMRLKALKKLVDANAADISRLLTLSHQQFYDADGSNEGRLANYALAWGVVAYLRDPANKAHAKTLERYLTTLLSTKDPDAAIEAAFPAASRPALQRAFNAYWKKRK